MIGIYKVHCGKLKWSGEASSIDDAIIKAIAAKAPVPLSNVVRVDVPREHPTSKRSFTAHYAWMSDVLARLGLNLT